MPKLLRSSETAGTGATIQLDSGEVVFVSIAQNGVLVRLIDLRSGIFKSLVSNFFGPTLYNEKNVYKNARTAQLLSKNYPETVDALSFKNIVLSAFANAVWRCSSASAVSVILNEALKNALGSDETAEEAAIQAAYNSAKNWEPPSPASRGLETFKVVFSDGVELEITHGRKNVDSWATERNRGQFPYKVVRVLDAKGNIVWGR